MAVTLIVENGPPTAVAVGLSPLAELTAHLHALTESEHHQQVVSAVAPASDPELVEQAHRWSPLWAAYHGRFLLPCRPQLGRGLTDELGDVADLPLRLFAEHAGYAIRAGNSGPTLDRLIDDPGQQRQLRRAAVLRSTARGELADRLLDSPADFRTDLVTFLSQYAGAHFADVWRELRPRLQAEVDRLRFRIRDRDVATALAELSPSATILDSPRRVVFDKLHAGVVRLDQRACLAIPSFHCWPHLLVKHEPGWPVVIQYGIQTSDRSAEVSLALLRSRLQALVDPSRIRLCRLIAREALSTVDLAQRSGMTEPQVSRHLRHLRDVELVRIERDGRLVRYQLDLDAIRALGVDLERAMLR